MTLDSSVRPGPGFSVCSGMSSRPSMLDVSDMDGPVASSVGREPLNQSMSSDWLDAIAIFASGPVTCGTTSVGVTDGGLPLVFWRLCGGLEDLLSCSSLSRLHVPCVLLRVLRPMANLAALVGEERRRLTQSGAKIAKLKEQSKVSNLRYRPGHQDLLRGEVI